MRYRFLVVLTILVTGHSLLQAQAVLDSGTVSYVSSQHVYVKFSSTEGINVGDTLFLEDKGVLVPALLVSNKSSVSCVCSRLISATFQVSNQVVARKRPVEKKKEERSKQEQQTNREALAAIPADAGNPEKRAREEDGPPGRSATPPQQRLRARLSAASYSNVSGVRESTRMRYSFSLQGRNLANSKLSTDAYVTFRHTLKEWDAVQNNLNDALKIYSLSVKYAFNESTSLAAGRMINPNISNLGAVDGIQFEKGIGHFLFGAIAGSRPDIRDYSINVDLMQAGAYVGLTSKENERHQQTILGIIEQHNKSAVDRRFVYAQHSDDLLKNLNVFGSMEMDLYQKVNGETQNRPSLTNLFVSLRYKFSRKLNASLSYDNRRNIIYYESYKSYIDQIIEEETRQGMRFGVNYRPVRLINWGLNASWRFQKSGANDAKNVNTYLSFNRIPFLKTSAMLSVNLLKASYINSRILGLRLMKDVLGGKVNLEAYYRRVDYNFPLYDFSTNQNVVGGSISWQAMKKLGLYVFAEQTFDSQQNNFLLFNTKAMWRF